MDNQKPVFNLETVEGLRELSEPGKDFFAELGEIYLKQAPEKVARMEAHLTARKFKEVGAIAHQLKSSTGNLGAERLAELFVRTEEAARAGDTENLLRLFPQLKNVFTETTAELARLVSDVRRVA